MKLKQATQQTEENAVMQTITYRSKEVKTKTKKIKNKEIKPRKSIASIKPVSLKQNSSKLIKMR